ERKAVIDEAQDRLTASALDLVRAVVNNVVSDNGARPSGELDTLRAQVHELMAQQPRPDPRPSAPAPVRPHASAPVGPDPALVARLDALEGRQRQHEARQQQHEARQQQHEARQQQHEASIRAELDQVKLRLVPLEDGARKAVDPRVRPGSHSSPASPVLPSAPPPHNLATKSDLELVKGLVETLQGNLERLSQHVEPGAASSSTLGKRTSADGPAGESERAAKAQRVGASVEGLEELSARVEALEDLSARVDSLKAEAATAESVGRFSQRVDAALASFDERFTVVEADVTVARATSDGALEQAIEAVRHAEETGAKVDAVDAKVTAAEVKLDALAIKVVAVKAERDDMDLEYNDDDDAKGLEKLEKRLGELGDKVDAELKPIKNGINALKTCADMGAAAAQALKENVVELADKVGTITNDIATVKRRSPSPASDAPTHPDQLLAAIQQLSARVLPTFTDSQRVVLVGLCRLIAGDHGDLPLDELEARLTAKVRKWDGAEAAIAAVKVAHARHVARVDAKVELVAILSDYLEQSALPELQRLCKLIWSWYEQELLPEAAWTLVKEDVEPSGEEDGADDEEMSDANGRRLGEGEGDDATSDAGESGT
ncbi:hypothetical protein JCM8208_006307, partial [Rhodotorula glutinis]